MAFSGWVASLSNSETVFEQQEPAGEPSTWQKLLAQLRESDVTMTQLRLQRGGHTVVGIEHAEGYCQCCEIQRSFFTGQERVLQGIGSVVGDKIFLTWMNEQGDVWQDVRDLKDMKIHTTLWRE